MTNYTDDFNKMACLDIYLASLSKEEYQKIKHKIRAQTHETKMTPLISGDISCEFAKMYKIEKQHEEDLQHLNQFSAKYDWEIDLSKLVYGYYHGLVLTDTNLTVCWVNDGFTKMTGYSAKDMIGQSPRILQGKNTSPQTRQRIREKIDLKVNFTDKIINYRKNKEEYCCKINVFPLRNRKNQVSHFLALESEIVL